MSANAWIGTEEGSPGVLVVSTLNKRNSQSTLALPALHLKGCVDIGQLVVLVEAALPVIKQSLSILDCSDAVGYAGDIDHTCLAGH